MLLIFLSLLLPVYADSWSKLGCYSSISVAESKGSYMYQSSGYCEQQCAGYRVAALKNGNECYCGDVDPTSQSNGCNIKCSGWPWTLVVEVLPTWCTLMPTLIPRHSQVQRHQHQQVQHHHQNLHHHQVHLPLHLQHQRNNHLPPPFKQQQPNRLQQNQSLPNNQKQQKNKKQLHHHVQPLNLEPLQ